MEQVFIVTAITVGSIVWLSLGYYGGRRNRKHFAQKYPVLRKTNDDWGLNDEVGSILFILVGPIWLVVVYLMTKGYPVVRDPNPDIHSRPMKPRHKSIFGNGGES